MSTATVIPAFKILGTSDEVFTCDCCGRTNLKHTVALDKLDAEGGETGDVVYYGSVCASVALGRGKTEKAGRAVFTEAEKVASEKRTTQLVDYVRGHMPIVTAADLVEVSVHPYTLVTIYTYGVHGLEVRANDADGRKDEWVRKTAAAAEFKAAFVATAAPLFNVTFVERDAAMKRLAGFRGRAA